MKTKRLAQANRLSDRRWLLHARVPRTQSKKRHAPTNIQDLLDMGRNDPSHMDKQDGLDIRSDIQRKL